MKTVLVHRKLVKKMKHGLDNRRWYFKKSQSLKMTEDNLGEPSKKRKAIFFKEIKGLRSHDLNERVENVLSTECTKI